MTTQLKIMQSRPQQTRGYELKTSVVLLLVGCTAFHKFCAIDAAALKPLDGPRCFSQQGNNVVFEFNSACRNVTTQIKPNIKGKPIEVVAKWPHQSDFKNTDSRLIFKFGGCTFNGSLGSSKGKTWWSPSGKAITFPFYLYLDHKDANFFYNNDVDKTKISCHNNALTQDGEPHARIRFIIWGRVPKMTFTIMDSVTPKLYVAPTPISQSWWFYVVIALVLIVLISAAWCAWSQYRQHTRRRQLAMQLEVLGNALVAQPDEVKMQRAAARKEKKRLKKLKKQQRKKHKHKKQNKSKITEMDDDEHPDPDAAAAATTTPIADTPAKGGSAAGVSDVGRANSGTPANTPVGTPATNTPAGTPAGTPAATPKNGSRASNTPILPSAGTGGAAKSTPFSPYSDDNYENLYGINDGKYDEELPQSVVLTPAQLAEAKERDRKIRAQLSKRKKKAQTSQEGSNERHGASPPAVDRTNPRPSGHSLINTKTDTNPQPPEDNYQPIGDPSPLPPPPQNILTARTATVEDDQEAPPPANSRFEAGSRPAGSRPVVDQ